MKKITFIFEIIVFSLQSQNSSYLAKVVNYDGITLSGNYILMDTSENYIEGGIFEDGNIRLNLTASLPLKLTLTAQGFESRIILLDSLELNKDKKVIFLNALNKRLKEVQIKSRKPLFEKTTDGTKVNVDNSILSRSTSAMELLTKIPSVSVVSGKLNVFGRGEALVIMNSQVISIESIKSLPVNDIKSIEIITNPDVRYDAKGKAVILIQLKNYLFQGYNLNITNNTTLGIVPEAYLGKYIINAPNIGFKLRKNKWEFESYYGNEYGQNWSENKFITSTNTPLGYYKKYGYYTEDNKNNSIHNYRAGVSYKLNSQSQLTAEYDGLSHLFYLDVKQNGDYIDPFNNLVKINMVNSASTRLQNHSGNLNFFHKLDSLGSNMFAGIQYSSFQNGLLDNITENISNPINAFSYNRINDGFNQIYLHTGQLDFSLKKSKYNLDFGGKMMRSRNDGRIQFFTKSESERDYIENTLLANSTTYREDVAALYANYKSTWNGVQYSFGLRWEYTYAQGFSNKFNQKIIDTSYHNFFPSLKFNFKLNRNFKLAASYAYKINRPIYQDLDPFLWYLDSLTSIQGNSNLRPEYIHQSELRCIHDRFVLRYSYSLARSVITPVMKQGSSGDNAVIFTKDNIEKRHRHSLALEIPFDLNKYSSYHTLALNFNQFNDSRPIYTALSNSPQFYAYTYHSYKIPNWFTVEFTGEFYGRSFDGFTERKPYYYFSLGLSKTFFKEDALSVSLLWNDFAQTALWAGKFNVNTFSNEYNQRSTTSYIRLTLNYTYTNKTAFCYKSQKINQTEFDRIKK